MLKGIEKYRKLLELPENAEKKEEYNKKQQKYGEKYRQKIMENRKKAAIYRGKKAKMMRRKRRKDRKARIPKKSRDPEYFQTNLAKSRAVKATEKSLPGTYGKNLEVVCCLAQKYGLQNCTLNVKKKKNYFTEAEDLIRSFYLSDIPSRQCPGIKDFMVIRDSEGKRQKVQKRVMTMSLNEAHLEFNNQFPDFKVSRSKFSSLRPKYVDLFSNASIYSCLCKCCSNMNLLMQSLFPFLNDSELNLKDVMMKFSCDMDNFDCSFGYCNFCNDFLNKIEELLIDCLNEMPVKFQQWEKSNGFEQKITVKTNFIGLISKINSLMPKYKVHKYIARTQSNMLMTIKQSQQPKHATIILDYSENYNCRSQNEIQSAYFARKQISCFTSVAYVGDEAPVSFLLVNDNISHNKEQIWYYLKLIVAFLNGQFGLLEKVYAFSDGACSQFKNRFNLSNILYAAEDFGTEIEWNFFATAHGKSSADGIGGCIKRGVYSRVLSGNYEVNSAEQFVECAKSFCKNINIMEVKQACIDRESNFLQQRWKLVKSIPKTREFHHFKKSVNPNCILAAFSSKGDGLCELKIIK